MERAASFPLAETAHRPGTMLLCISALLLIGVRRVGGDTSAVTQPNIQSELQCVDWGVSAPGTVRVLEGEAGWLRCPLFSHPTLYSYSSAQSSGLSLVWYRVGAGQVLEQPINLKLPSYHKDREWLWIQPAEARDAGQYICMLRNISSCVKIALHLEVVPRNGQGECVMVAAVPTQNISIPIEHHHTITCPDLQNTTLPNSTYSVTWYHHCRRDEFRGILHREIKGASLIIYTMYEIFTGPYTCVVSYHSNGRTLNFTRVVNVSAVSSPKLPKEPKIFTPYEGQVFTVKLGEEVVLTCTASLPHLNNEQQQLWWTVDGKTTEQLSNPRFTTSLWLVTEHFGDQVKGVELRVQEFSQEDLQRQYNCSVQNSRGFETRVARLEKEKYVPSLELGCGLGVTLFLMLMMFVVYHVFWLELLLLYRSWFGSDERLTDDKEYDVYISYARNSEEEQFVLLTLRRVLENELGYTVCIFDRDSLPGGTITDETLSFVGLSRRLIVVISPSSMLQGTQALLELKAGLDSMVWGGHLRVILVQYQPVQRASWVRELKRARIALALIRWKGEESSSLSSRFWKRLQVELPIRRLRELQSRDNGEEIPLKGKAASDIQERLHTNEDGKTHTTQSS